MEWHDYGSEIDLADTETFTFSVVTPTKWQRFKQWLGHKLHKKTPSTYKLVLSDHALTATAGDFKYAVLHDENGDLTNWSEHTNKDNEWPEFID